MTPQRVAIIGGPGSGKTTLIENLETQGYACMHEISREVTRKAQEDGVDQLFLKDPILFSKLLLEGRLKQFEEAAKIDAPFVFFDRGLPDVPIYMDFIQVTYPDYFPETCRSNRYDAIFMLPPWGKIYKQDNERYESFEQAEMLYSFLKNGYQSYDYNIIEVPIGTVAERTSFITNNLKKHI